MYITDFMCTYKLMDTENDQQAMFQIQFLQAFNIQVYNFDQINMTLYFLYSNIKDNKDLNDIINSFVFPSEYVEQNQTEMEIYVSKMIFLFSYETFDLFHLCLIDFFKSGNVQLVNLMNLKNKLHP
jgi:hypothetical protein